MLLYSKLRSAAESCVFFQPLRVATQDSWSLAAHMGGVPLLGNPFAFYDLIESIADQITVMRLMTPHWLSR